MKLVVLDSKTANPGDLNERVSWSTWKEIPHIHQVEIYERTAPEELIPRAEDAALLITNKTVISAASLERLPKLRYIGVLATGYNVVDVEAAHNRGITVTNIPAYSTASVAQMTIAHLLNITQQVGLHHTEVQKGTWQQCDDFCFYRTPLIELSEMTMGIVGLGNTGTATARVAQSMGMHILAWSSRDEKELKALDMEKAKSLEQLFRQSDVLSLHCPLTPETRHIIRKETLSWMKPSAIILNTGRGALVCEEDLAEALNKGKLYAAGVDVLEQEPPLQGSPLIGARNCFITPHIAWATRQARERLMDIARDNVESFLNGEAQNQV